MVWSAPRTWTDGEIVTATIFNQHLRDNLQVLKVTRNSLGRIYGLSSATLADLSSGNLTGLGRIGADNTFTSGRHRFQSAARVVVPVGADKYVDLGGGLRKGVWVEGDYLHHIASNQTTEWRYLGAYVSTPAGAVPGSVWVEGDFLHYIDADGDERRCQSRGEMNPHIDSAAAGGSWWVESYQHWIRETGSVEKPGHNDVPHSDGTVHLDTHTDVPHSDSAHGDSGHADSHADTTHADVHQDTHLDSDSPHADNHFDTHTDSPHVDTHTDVPHADDAHADHHNDVHDDHSDHGDASHLDQPTVVA